MLNSGFDDQLSDGDAAVLQARARAGRLTVLTATTVAGSGHPGGSFSSMEIYTVLYGCARLRSEDPQWEERDRIVVSHGHTSPGVYAALAETGFFSSIDVAAHFRQAGSVFEGHVARGVPGVEWSTGNLGQGLSVGVGMALAARVSGTEWRTYVAMSDGGQMKGQVAEARRLAAKERLTRVTAIVDWNHIQISGRTEDVMPVDIPAVWRADGWSVYECDGHDVRALYEAIAQADADEAPAVVLAHTVIGKGVSFMENQAEFHGRSLVRDEYLRAMTELGGSPEELGAAVVRRSAPCQVVPVHYDSVAVELEAGVPRTYEAGTKVDNRSAWGTALAELAERNADLPMLVFDCDLATSVKTDKFAELRPQSFIECGVGEHNAAAASGAASAVPGVLSFFSDFGVFGIDEVYNQQRLNDINRAAVKLALTHCGLDVGEDGKTHHCLDYIGAMREFFGWRVIVPADANQTDRAVRAAAAMSGCVAIAMGRSKLPVITGADGQPLFAGEYSFEYGKVVWAREGMDGCLLVTGTLSNSAIEAADALRDDGISIRVGVVACPLELSDADMDSASMTGTIITVEDHHLRTGLGATVAERIAERGCGTRLVRAGVDGYQSSGTAEDLLKRCGLDRDGIASLIHRTIM